MKNHISVKYLNAFFIPIAIGITFLFLLSCNSIAKKELSSDRFFDASDYFNREIERLKKNNPKTEKTIIFNNVEEKNILADIDWKNELAVFVNTNINKPAVYEYYEVDSILKENILQIKYQSTNDKMITKNFEVYYDNNIVTTLKMLQTKKNLIFQSNTTFEYVPNAYYKIEKKKSLLWFAPDDIIINVAFL